MTIVASLAMTALTTLTAADFSKAVVTFDALLRAQKDVINRLNVYPVPDGDTGTNMSLTMQSVVKGLKELPASATLGDVVGVVSSSSLMGARGNSGVILSQMLRGLTSTFPTDGVVDTAQLVAGLTVADELARQAVSRPVEGTILSVARAAAEGARREQGCLESLVHGARDAARSALALTPEQLPVLKQAGVVDSGGTGLVLWFEALCNVVAGDPLPEVPDVASLPDVAATAWLPEPDTELRALAGLKYEVMFLLEGDDGSMPAFRQRWETLGDSIVIVGGDGLYNCHVHTDDVGAAIEASLDVGRPRDIRVTDLLEEVREESWVVEGGVTPSLQRSDAPTTAVVAVVTGEGVAQLFSSLGARELVVGGQTMNPSTADLVAAVNASGSQQVIVLPNNKNIRAVAEQVQGLVSARVLVVPTTSVTEGLAAMVGYNGDATVESNASVMSSFASAVDSGEVTRAVRDTSTEAGPVHEGDWIGLTKNGVSIIGQDLTDVATRLLTTLCTDRHELVTILAGEGSTPAITEALVAHMRARHGDVSVDVHFGGQPLYPYLFGFE